jgi:hypothetical protein
MHSVLLIIEKPNIEIAANNQAWLSILGSIDNHINSIANAPNDDCTKKLADSILLIDLKNALFLFVNLTSKAQSAGFAYRVLFFEKEPERFQYNP